MESSMEADEILRPKHRLPSGSQSFTSSTEN
jgi:hypothetical protein